MNKRKKSTKVRFAFRSMSVQMKLKVAGITTLSFLILSVYFIVLSGNVEPNSPSHYYFAKSDMTIDQFCDSLSEHSVVKNGLFLRIMAEIRGVNTIRKGLYQFRKGLNNYQIVSQIRKDAVKPHVVAELKPYRLRKNMVMSLCDNFPNINKEEVWELLRDKKFLDSLGFTHENVFCIFLPGKYHMYEHINARELIERLHHEFQHFWNHRRIKKAKKQGLGPVEVTILSSIVYSETKNRAEMTDIAGVYINRLRKRMLLQSDPTVVYAAHKFGARRVYFADRKINSYYNTYLYKGLPPGPIHVVPQYVIDEVLEYDQHDYLFFCAKDDMSGCHLFSTSFEDHKEHASRYRKALDKAGIR